MRENAALLQRGASKPTDGPTTTPPGSEGSRPELRRVARAARKTLRPQAEADPFQAADERDAIARALVALPEGQREAVVMVEWLGMTDDEVGQILGISPITVRVRIHRARGTMR